MRSLVILTALVFGLFFTISSAFAQSFKYSDMFISPETNTNFFGGYLGGDDDTPTGKIDWSIGNCRPFSLPRTDDMVFSTSVGDFNNPDDWFERMRITKDGFVGIGTTSPAEKLHVSGGDFRLDGDMHLHDNKGNTGISLRSDHAAGVAGEVSLFNDNGLETVELLAAEGTDNGGQITLSKANGTRTVQLDAEFGPDGGAYLELNGGSSESTLYVEGSAAGRTDAALRVHNIEPDQGMAAYITNNSTWATMHIQNDGSGETLWVESSGGGNLIVARDNIARQWQFWVDGDGNTNVRNLVIYDGADLSERFEVCGLQVDLNDQSDPSTGNTPEPGMVVSIDPENPGKLAISSKSYDRKVAGIISGAGGLNTGMLMSQSDSDADGNYPVALSGRIYCLCVASNGPIQPGDLLTSSDNPGYAMRVTDHSKAQGAIIGKAMTSLQEGRGLVLTLVSLQ